MAGRERLIEQLLDGASEVQSAVRELVQSPHRGISLERVGELETAAHQAIGAAAQAARVLAREAGAAAQV